MMELDPGQMVLNVQDPPDEIIDEMLEDIGEPTLPVIEEEPENNRDKN